MRVEIEQLKTGWFEISIGLNERDFDLFIEQLKMLKKQRKQHFHIMSDYDGPIGVGDIEFYFQGELENNMEITGGAIEPNG